MTKYTLESLVLAILISCYVTLILYKSKYIITNARYTVTVNVMNLFHFNYSHCSFFI